MKTYNTRKLPFPRQLATTPYKATLWTGSVAEDGSPEVAAARGTVSVVSDTVYARRLYFHPEYNFQTIKNPYAGAEWFDDYITGAKKEYPQRLFAKFMRREMQ